MLPYAVGIVCCYSSLPSSRGNKAVPGLSNTGIFGFICHLPAGLWFPVLQPRRLWLQRLLWVLPCWQPLLVWVVRKQGSSQWHGEVSVWLTPSFRGIKWTALGGNKSIHNSYCYLLISQFIFLLSRIILHILGYNTGRICLKTIKMQNLRLHGSIILHDLLSGFCQALHCHQRNIW